MLAYSLHRAALSHYISFLTLSSFKCLSLQLTKSELNRTRNRKVLYTNITLPQDILVDKTFRSRDRFMMEETLPKWTCKISYCCCSSLAHPYPNMFLPIHAPSSTIFRKAYQCSTHILRLNVRHDGRICVDTDIMNHTAGCCSSVNAKSVNLKLQGIWQG